MPATTSNVIPFRREPTRAQDEQLLNLLDAFEAAGIVVVGEDDPIPTGAALIVEPYELEAMAAHVRSPRIAPVASPLGPMWELLLKPWRPVS